MHILQGLCIFLKRYKYIFVIGVTGIAILVATEYREHHEVKVHHELVEKSVGHIFLDGNYEDYLQFIKDQSKGKQLEWKQFQEISGKYKQYEPIEKNVEFLELVASLKMGVEACLCRLQEKKDLIKKEELLDFAFFMYVVQLAESSPYLFTKEVYKDLLRVKKSVELLKEKDAEGAFSYYVEGLANLLDLDKKSPLERYLLKEAVKRGIYTKVEIERLKMDLLAKGSDEICKIIHGEYEGEHQSLENPKYPLHQK